MALIGFPHDEGCARNGGRPGAKDAPDIFRTHIHRTGCVPNPKFSKSDFSTIDIVDFGNVGVGLDYDACHTALRMTVRNVIQEGFVPFVIGGSNDQSYFNARGLLDNLINKKESLGVINVDAHLDVRPKKNGLEHSGSPFRMLLEDEDFKGKGNLFMEFAAQSHQCSQVMLIRSFA